MTFGWEEMKDPRSSTALSRFLWGAVGTMLAAAAGAAAYLYAADWRGVRDVQGFLIATSPLAVFIGLVASVLGRDELRILNAARYALGIVIGAVLGLLFALAAAASFGRWLAACSVPAAACWVGGAAAGLASGLTLWPGRGKVVELVILCGLSVVAVTVYEPIRIKLSSDQQLTVVFLKWRPGDSPAPGDSTERMSPAVRAALSSAGLDGSFEFAGSAMMGKGPRSLAVVVIRERPRIKLTTYVPDADTIVYVQRPGTFELIPGTSQTLDRALEIYPERNAPERIEYQVKLADGSRQGGLAMTWEGSPGSPPPPAPAPPADSSAASDSLSAGP